MNNTKNKQLIPFLICLAAAILTILSFFLPYASAKDDQKAYLEENADAAYTDVLDMDNGDAIHLSLLEYTGMYGAIAGNEDYEVLHPTAISCMVLTLIVAAFSLAVLLFAVLRKAIPLLIFTVLQFFSVRLLDWDFDDRGVLPSSDYGYGFGHYLYFICAALLAIGAIWLLIAKIQAKKEAQQTAAAPKEEETV